MALDRYIGRVGALAVALGIGSAVAAMPGQASATPDADGGSGTSETSLSGPARAGSGTDATPRSGKPAQTERSATTEPSGESDPPDRSPREVADTEEPTSGGTSDNDAEPVDETRDTVEIVPPTEPVTPVPAVETDDAPDSPGASSLLWFLGASTRRQTDQQVTADRDAASQTAAQAEAPIAETPVPGDASASPIIGVDGTVYQVTRTSSAGGRFSTVTILDNTGQIVASGEVRGTVMDAVARPDGTLVVFSRRFISTTVSAVSGDGSVTPIANLLGTPLNPPRVGPDGALYFGAGLPDLLSPVGANVGYRTYRISPRNTVRAFAFDTDVAIADDGTAYLVSRRYGISVLRVIPTAGLGRTTLLPLGTDPSAPILGPDGTAHVTAGVTWFGSPQTRVYTATGDSIATRTVAGLPAGAVVGADGVYLATFVEPGSGGPYTSYVSRLTAAGVGTSDPIDGRIAEFQVTADGTVFAPIDGAGTETPVAVIDRDGTVRTVLLPGTLVVGRRAIRDGGTYNVEDVGYVNYAAAGREYVAVLNPDGTVARTVELPDGATGGSVFYSPDGAAFEMLEYRDAQGQTVFRQILALASTTYTDKVPGGRFTYVRDAVVFGPDGVGYLLTGSVSTQIGASQDLDVLGFNAAGETVSRAGGLTNPVTTYENNPYRAVLAFGRDGTAYVTLYFTPDDPGVYAVTATGAQKVVDLEYVQYHQGFPPTFGLDGTGYVTSSELLSGDADGIALVTVFAPVTAL